MNAGRGYRPDIDGLRAIAVLAVVGYHYFPQWVPAGFVGVDVFFVISGYLISGIILERVEAGRFSLADFYARRIRRIFPALIVMMLAVAAIGWGLLYSEEYQLLGRHIAAGAAFATNLLLWSETGYFNPAAETKPLLHLWSLGVEEQFYLVWPVVFAFVCRGARARFWAVVAILAASLAACIIVTPGNAEPAFYLPMYRFWELMAGAALVVAPHWVAHSARDANVRAWAGVALLVASAVVIRPHSAFPGWRAMLPVGATVLLVSAGPQAFVNRTVLSLRGLVGIGLISYPLYLWHWPLLSLLRIANNDAPVTVARGSALFAVALGLSWVTYVALERPIRTGPHRAAKTLGTALAMVCVAVAGLALYDKGGVPSREVNSRDPTWPSRDGRQATDVNAWLVDCPLGADEAKLFRRCTRDSRGPERFALLGDSKAEALFHGIVRTSRPEGRWMFIGGATGHDTVLPLLSDAYRYREFQAPSRVALRAVEADERVETVVLVAATRSLFFLRGADSIDDLPESIYEEVAYEGFSRYVKHLVAAGKKVVIVADHPTLPDPRRCLTDARVTWHGHLGRFFAIGQPDPRCEQSLDRHVQLAAKYRDLIDKVAKVAPDRVRIFETTPYVCDMARRRCSATEAGQPLYSFADHVSDFAATRIGQGLNDFLLRGGAQAGVRPAP